MSPHTVSSQFSSNFKIDREKKIGNSQSGQVVGESGLFLAGILIVGILFGVFINLFDSRSSCEKQGFTERECATAAIAEFPYADNETCFTLQESLQQTKCQSHNDCSQLPGVPHGSYTSDRDVEIVVIQAGVMHYLFEDRSTIDGCFDVMIDGANVTWESNSSGLHCEEIRYLQLWNIPLCKVE